MHSILSNVRVRKRVPYLRLAIPGMQVKRSQKEHQPTSRFQVPDPNNYETQLLAALRPSRIAPVWASGASARCPGRRRSPRSSGRCAPCAPSSPEGRRAVRGTGSPVDGLHSSPGPVLRGARRSQPLNKVLEGPRRS